MKRILGWSACLFLVAAASPVAVPPVQGGDSIVIASFDFSRTGRPFSGPDYDNLRGRLTDPANFGAGGVVDADVVLAPDVSVVSAASLAGVDCFVITEVTSLSNQEVNDLVNFVYAGGALVLITNSSSSGYPGASLVMQALDGGSIVSPTGGSNGGTEGSFVARGAAVQGVFGKLGLSDTFASTVGGTLLPGTETFVTGRTAAGTFDLMAEIRAGGLAAGSGPVLIVSDVIFMDFFIPPATLYGNESNATLFLNFIGSLDS